MPSIKFLRGNYADQPLLSEGEPGFALDEGLLSVGTGSGNVLVGRVLQDTLANRPAAGIYGRFFRATDTGDMFVDNGSSWVAVFDSLLTSAADFPATQPSREMLLWHTTNEKLYLFVPSLAMWVDISGTDGGGYGVSWRDVSSNDNVVAGDGLFIDCSSNPITLTLPASPINGDKISFLHVEGDLSSNTVTIARNGNKIQGATEDLVVDVPDSKLSLVFRSSASDWRIY